MSLEESKREEVSVINLIPNKPPCRLGPFELHNDHLVSANLHKKVLGRSEKLYLTEKPNATKGASRIFFMIFGTFLLLALLVGVTIFCTVGENQSLGQKPVTTPLDSTTTLTTSKESFTTSSSSVSPTSSAPLPPLDNTYVPLTADVEFSLTNVTWEEALADNSSAPFHDLSASLYESVVDVLTKALKLGNILMQVQVFSPGENVYVKLRLTWTEPALPFDAVSLALVSTSSLGQYPIKHLKSYGVYNMCKFMNNGCSHNCTFQDFHFHCTCPHPLTLVPKTKQCALAVITTEAPTTRTSSTEVTHTQGTTTISQSTSTSIPPSTAPSTPTQHSTSQSTPTSTSSTTPPTPKPETDEQLELLEITTLEPVGENTEESTGENTTSNNEAEESTTDTLMMIFE